LRLNGFNRFPDTPKNPLEFHFISLSYTFFAPHELQLQIRKSIKNALFQSNSNLFKDKILRSTAMLLNLLLKLDNPAPRFASLIPKSKIEIRNSKIPRPCHSPFNVLTFLAAT
jgi:hypothetical protein